MNRIEYYQGSDLPDLALTWLDRNDAVIDFSTGWTFTLKVGRPGETALITKSSNIFGAPVAPNVTVSWATTGELNTIAAGEYLALLTAIRSADGKQRTLPFTLIVAAAVL